MGLCPLLKPNLLSRFSPYEVDVDIPAQPGSVGDSIFNIVGTILPHTCGTCGCESFAWWTLVEVAITTSAFGGGSTFGLLFPFSISAFPSASPFIFSRVF